MNIVDTCLPVDRRPSPPDAPAVLYEAEFGEVRSLSYAELDRHVAQAAGALRSLGLGKGDAVGIFLPMIPEIVVALLAVAKIGGVVLPLFSGFGAGAVASRLADGDARALITADGLPRRGSIVPLKPIADEACQHVPGLRHMLVVRHMGNRVSMQAGRDHWWHELVDLQPVTAPTEPTEAEDTLMIIYTSGTTGRPKGAVHTHCGFPVKAAQDMAFGTDVHPGDRMYWITDMGWMMGPWLVFGTLLLGATMFLYDGAPDYPGSGPGVGDGRAAPSHSPRHLAHADPRPDAARRATSALARPLLVAALRLDRRALEPGAVDVAVPGRRRSAACRSSTTPAARRSPAGS